jgi:sugar phosphate isomerase/epimerase
MPRFRFGERSVVLGYSANVRPAQTIAQVHAHLRGLTAAVRRDVAPGRLLGWCGYFGSGALRELREAADGVAALRDSLAEAGAFLCAVNAFPLGDFHARVVKAAAYRPDWTRPERRAMTEQVVALACALAPEGGEVAVSTVAGGYRPEADAAAEAAMATALVATAQTCRRLAAETGRHVRVCLEPEPWTVCETVADAVRFFQGPVYAAAQAAGAAHAMDAHLGVNLDLCHAAVEHEDPLAAADALARAGVRLGSVHAAAALRVPTPDAAALERLRAFDEPRYLHQVVAGRGGLPVGRWRDLPELFAAGLGDAAPDELRVHFHVPLDAATVEGFPTSAAATLAALRGLLGAGHTDTVIAETYTWGVGALAEPGDLAARLAAELRWLIDGLGLRVEDAPVRS